MKLEYKKEGREGRKEKESVEGRKPCESYQDQIGTESRPLPAGEGDVLSIIPHKIWLSLSVNSDKEGEADLPDRTWHQTEADQESGSPMDRLPFKGV